MQYKEALAFARHLRSNQTAAEQRFWEAVRNKRFHGLKFLRQFIIEHQNNDGDKKYYIVDFYCHAHRLIIEIDGAVHSDQVDYDRAREAVLKEMGMTVLRFTNDEVLSGINDVKKRIEDLITE